MARKKTTDFLKFQIDYIKSLDKDGRYPLWDILGTWGAFDEDFVLMSTNGRCIVAIPVSKCYVSRPADRLFKMSEFARNFYNHDYDHNNAAVIEYSFEFKGIEVYKISNINASNGEPIYIDKKYLDFFGLDCDIYIEEDSVNRGLFIARDGDFVGYIFPVSINNKME